MKALGNDESKYPKDVVQALFCLYLTLQCRPDDPNPIYIPHVGVEMDQAGNCKFFYKRGNKKIYTNFVDYLVPIMARDLKTDSFTQNIRNSRESMKNYHLKLFCMIKNFLDENDDTQKVLKVMRDKLRGEFKLESWIKHQPAPAPAPEPATTYIS